MPIKVQAPVNQTVPLKITDPTGETYVVIRPADYGADLERGKALEKRTLVPHDDGSFSTQVDANLNELWALEIWLSYVETNLVVEYTDSDENVVETVRFEPKGQISRDEFMRRLRRLPPGIVYEWHNAVLSVIPNWSIPF